MCHLRGTYYGARSNDNSDDIIHVNRATDRNLAESGAVQGGAAIGMKIIGQRIPQTLSTAVVKIRQA